MPVHPKKVAAVFCPTIQYAHALNDEIDSMIEDAGLYATANTYRMASQIFVEVTLSLAEFHAEPDPDDIAQILMIVSSATRKLIEKARESEAEEISKIQKQG